MRCFRPIDHTEYQEKYERIFSLVFSSKNPFEDPFAETVPCRALLDSVNYKLDKAQMTALKTAAKAVLDQAIIVTSLGLVENEDNHWYIPLNELEQYHSISGPVFILENAIYSPSGKWGLMFSHEDFVVSGGEKEFIDIFFEELGTSVDEQVHTFLRDWKNVTYSANVAWIPTLLAHLFGEKKAKEFLTEGGWI